MALQDWRCFLKVSVPTLTVDLLFQFPINAVLTTYNSHFFPDEAVATQAGNYFCHSSRHVLNIPVLRENKYEGTRSIPAVFMEEWVHIGSISRA